MDVGVELLILFGDFGELGGHGVNLGGDGHDARGGGT